MGRFPIRLIGLGKQIDFLGRHMDYVESSTSGDTYFSIYRGSGMEFKGHRVYTFQDSARNIDWKASLRSDRLLIKEYYQEKGMDVVFVYDVSETMLFGSQSKIKAHYGAEFILTLASTALESNYNVGLVCFSDKIEHHFQPASGKEQMGLFFDVLGRHNTYGGKYDLTKVLEYVDSTCAPGTVIILVSDFLGNKVPLDKFKNKFQQLARKFDVISVILRDPRDEFMPKDNMNMVVSDPYEGGQLFINVKKIRKEYEKYTKEQKTNLRSFLKKVNSEQFEIYTDKPFLDSTVAFFSRRGPTFN
jgi:uncharacterized protein (DUF58 family)